MYYMNEQERNMNKDTDHCSEKGYERDCVDISIISNDQLAEPDEIVKINLSQNNFAFVEQNDNDKFNTGGDGFYTRKLYENSKSFEPIFKITSFCNHLSEKNTSDAIWKK